MTTVTQAEYARLRGVSKTSVFKAVKAGRITLTADGKVDVDAANISWAARTDSTQQHRGAPAEFAKTQPLARASAAAKGEKNAPIGTPKTSDHGFGLSLLEEKTRAERLRIRRQEIELAELEGLSVSREAVVAALSAKLMSASETLRGIPDRLGAVIAAETNAGVIHKLLTDEIASAMAVIATVPDGLL